MFDHCLILLAMLQLLFPLPGDRERTMVTFTGEKNKGKGTAIHPFLLLLA